MAYTLPPKGEVSFVDSTPIQVRSPANFVINLPAGSVACCFQPKKPSITPLAEHQISFA